MKPSDSPLSAQLLLDDFINVANNVLQDGVNCMAAAGAAVICRKQ